MNDELTLDGVKYISAKRAAEITQYSRDYIGQLCRGGKILGRRIGRNWYVSEDSIIRHKTTHDVEENNLSSNISNPRISTQSVKISDILSQKNDKGNEQEDKHSSKFLKEVYNWPLANYESDNEPLFLQLVSKEENSIKINKPEFKSHTLQVNESDYQESSIPVPYIDKHPVISKTDRLERVLVAVLVFTVVSIGIFTLNGSYIHTVWTETSGAMGANTLEAFNSTANMVNVAVDNIIYFSFFK